MTDYFALFQEPRRPWINPDEIKGAFLKLSAEVHPDRFHGAPDVERARANQKFIELNTAYQCLSQTKDRLRHLLELERGSRPKEIEKSEPGMMELFMDVAALLREADSFIESKNKVTSPVLKVQWFERGMQWTEKLQQRQRLINERREALEDELRSMNSLWSNAPPPGTQDRIEALPLDRLESVYREMSHFHRWTAQIQERITQLAL